MANIEETTMPIDENREFHVGVLGVTGFVGKLIADYLCRYYANGELKFIFAGRNVRRLEDMREDLCNHYALKSKSINIMIADVADYSSLVELARRCKVLITTVGPYLMYGEPVARACVQTGTHYCDLTGEMPFVALLHARHGTAARQRGVKLVSFCGFDSVPSDMCVLMIQKRAVETVGKPCPQIKMAVRKMRGGLSGATLASAVNLIGHSSMTDPYYLVKHALKSQPQDLPIQPRVCMIHPDRDFGYGTIFVMSRVNENVVRWSNALQNWAYGKGFLYYEMLACSFNFFSALFAMLGTYAGLMMMSCSATRWLAKTFKLIPAAGEGPTEETLNSGYFSVEAIGRVGGQMLRARVASFLGDPGYRESAKMIVECALCLALEMPECTRLTGPVSPAAGIGEPLIRRLNAVGVKCEVTTEADSSTPSKPASKVA